jgi:hypothetical protein
MAFQNNSGDIILDVVLTDEGRRRLAQGNNSFSVVKFALGDDEINYSLFNTAATTALQDLSILQTPILEAFTNNGSSMKSKLLSLTNQNLLYLPILKLNTVVGDSRQTSDNNYVVCVDKRTFDDSDLGTTTAIGYSSNGVRDGFLYGLDTDSLGGFVRIDAGIDSTDVTEIDESLIETQFMVEIDDRLGQIISKDGKSFPGFVSRDDDFIATYVFTKQPGDAFVRTPSQENPNDASTPINGPIASTFEFKIRSSQDLRVSNFLFNRIGGTTSTSYSNRNGSLVSNVKFIDSIVRVTGMTTGYAIDIPVRFAKI